MRTHLLGKKKKKNIYIYMYVFQVSALKKLGTVGRRSALPFYFIEIFYIEIAFSLHFCIFDNIFLAIRNKKFMVGAKT